MIVQVKDLKPNPYRNMEKYPIDRFKVDALKNSINETEFWDNLLAREKDGQIQIAYGHHRLTALKELGIKEVDIPVKELDDATMIRIMANENMDDWKMSPAVINETVRAAKDFLDGELKKYETFEQVNNSIKPLFGSPETFTQTKIKGVGQTIILKFLGKNWKQWMIQSALNSLEAKDVDIKAVEAFKNISDADVFKSQVREKNKREKNRIPKKIQPKLAERVASRLVEKKADGTLKNKSGRYTMGTLIEQELEEIKAEEKNPESKSKISEVKQLDEFEASIKHLEVQLGIITAKTKELKNKIDNFNGEIGLLGVTHLKGLKTYFLTEELSQLLEAINVMSNYFGIQFNFSNDEKSISIKSKS